MSSIYVVRLKSREMENHDLLPVNLEQHLSLPHMFIKLGSVISSRIPSDVDYEEGVQRCIQRYFQLRTKASQAGKLTTLCEYCVSIPLPSRESKARTIYSPKLGEINEAAEGQRSCAMCSFLIWPIDFLAESVKRNKDSLLSTRTTSYPKKRQNYLDVTLLEMTELRQVDSELSYDETTTAIVKYDICRLATGPTADDSVFSQGNILNLVPGKWFRDTAHCDTYLA